ncbi:unnamed protein product [Orchesella dallaii]|uniref:Gustatory receptor n=1 Tax=Orchesella dallaii TaxID=48710 RepID=A0ABP1PP88_9HEXA
MKRFWMNSYDFVRVLNFISVNESSLSSDDHETLPLFLSRITTSKLYQIVFVLYTAMAFLSLLVGKYFLATLTNWTISWWFRRLVMLTRYALFYGDLLPEDQAPEMAAITSLDIVFSSIAIAGLLTRYLMGFLSDLIVLSLTLTLWTAANSFSKRIEKHFPLQNYTLPENEMREIEEKDDSMNWTNVYQQFDAIRILSHLINISGCHIVSSYLLEASLSYSVNLDGILLTKDAFRRANQMFYYACTASILFFSADICRKLESLKLWLSEEGNRIKIPEDEFNMVLHEMMAKDIGIKGSNVFTITYSFLATNPAQYFLLIMNTFNFTYKSVFVKRMWRNKTQFLHIVNFIVGERALPAGNAKVIRKAIIIGITLGIYVVMAFGSLVAGKYFLVDISEWSPSWWYRRLVQDTRYMLFYGNTSSTNEGPELNDITALDQFFSVINSVGLISRYLLGFFTDLCIFSMVLTLWSASYSFANGFNNLIANTDGENETHPLYKRKRIISAITTSGSNLCSGSSWQQIYETYKAIRMLSVLINSALGSIVFWFLGDAIMAYSVNMDAFLIAKNVYKRANLSCYYFCTFGILFMAGDICTQMESIKHWLADDENRKTVPSDQMEIVLHEMLAKDIGIRGNNIFTLTYSIAATFIGTIVTYFIICVQQNAKL